MLLLRKVLNDEQCQWIEKRLRGHTVKSAQSKTPSCRGKYRKVVRAIKQENDRSFKRHSRSFKVTDFGSNRQPIYDVILVNDVNFHCILLHFGDIVVYWSRFRL